MLGAIIGDIAGSKFEFNNYRGKDFGELLDKYCQPTDDTYMTLAIANAILETEEEVGGAYSGLDSEEKEQYLKFLKERVIYNMQLLGQVYPDGKYGMRFLHWIYSSNPKPYNSFGNGSAMRVSPVAYIGKTIKEVKELSKAVTEVTHNHPEGIKGAESIAVAIYLLRNGMSKEELKDYISENYYQIDFTLDEIRDTNRFDETCQITVPQAFECFFESDSFEDCIRNAISIGGDSDTIGAIAGSLAEAYYGISEDLELKAESFLDKFQLFVLLNFKHNYIDVHLMI